MNSTRNTVLPKAWTDDEMSDSANWDFGNLAPGEARTALEYELQRELRHAYADQQLQVPPPFPRLIDECTVIGRTTFEPVCIPQRLRAGREGSQTFVAVADPSRLRPAPESLLPPERNRLGPGREPTRRKDPGEGEPYQWPSHTVRSPELGPRVLVAIDPRDLFWRLQYGNREELLNDLATVCHLPKPSDKKAGRQVAWPWLQAHVPAWVKVAPEELLKTLGYLRLISAGRADADAWSGVYRAPFPPTSGHNGNPETFYRNLNRQCDRIRLHLAGMKSYLRTPRTWIALNLADKQD
jgi:hypothetical protein